MLGALIMVLVLVIGLPGTFMAGGAVLAVVLGQSLWRSGETGDRELLELNR